MSSKSPMDVEIKILEYLSCLTGAGSERINALFRIFGSLLWLFSLLNHFSYETYEAVNVYGYTFLVAQGVWFLAFLILTWGLAYRTLPWLENGLQELRTNKCYDKSITKLLRSIKRIPYVMIIFSLVSSAIQHALLFSDNALHVDYGQNATQNVRYILHAVRFFTGAHVYAAYILFWLLPTCIMLMSGHAMKEFMDQMGGKLRDKRNLLTFKEAISSYSMRAKFVKTSSSKSFVVLALLLFTGVFRFGLNVYSFLFGKRRYLHLWHSLLPLAMMIYPLCTAAWVTKQYAWFTIVVVRAWVHRDDLDETSDENSGEDEAHDSQSKHANLNDNQSKHANLNESLDVPTRPASKLSLRVNESNSASKHQPEIRRKSWNEVVVKSASMSSSSNLQKRDDKESILLTSKQESESKLRSSLTKGGFLNTAKMLGKFRYAAKRPHFNFEKFLSYLESMRSVVGFEIAGIIVTWDLVSTTLFLLFSIVAVFVQESIFGDQKSTL